MLFAKSRTGEGGNNVARTYRKDEIGQHRTALEKNKKKIFATQTVCALCGKPVDFSLKYPNPLAPSIDHIVPINRGGHPSDISNLQLAHWTCNRQKADKLQKEGGDRIIPGKLISNRNLPQSADWSKYKG